MARVGFGGADVGAGIRAAALRRAIDEAETIERMAAGARLQSYRSYLQATVRYASPILLAAVGREGVLLDDVVQGLRPPPDWPRRDYDAHAYRHAAAALAAGAAGRWSSPGAAMNAYLARGGSVVRLATRSLGVLIVRVVGGSVEVSLRLGTYRMSSSEGVGRLRLNRFLPETATTGCVGRALSAVVDHPLLRRAAWTVDRIEGRGEGGRCSVLVFATGQEPIVLPWS